MTNSSLLDKLEKDIVYLLLDELERLEITPARAAQIARFAIHSLPENSSEEQIKQLIPKLDDDFIELAEVVHKYLTEYESANQDTVLKNVEELMKQEKFQEANNLMKLYMEKKL